MNKEIRCYICSTLFKRQYNLSVHLREFRCKSPLLNDLEALNELLKNVNNENLQKKINGENGDIKQKVNPITQLDLKNNRSNNILLLEKFDENMRNENSLIDLLTQYIRNIICNMDNHKNKCIMYITKRPVKFHVVVDDNNTIIDTASKVCDLYSHIFLKIIKKGVSKSEKYLNNSMKTNEEHDNENLENHTELFYDTHTITTLSSILKSETSIDMVKRALKNVLNIYILYDKNMKYQG